jgi:wobble nucleotide-excising tRNase
MLKRIKSIKNLRNLIDFKCEEELSKHSNVIYALNGTGKTSLSRFFSCFQGEEVDINKLKEFLSLEADGKGTVDFTIEFEGSIVSSSNLRLPANQKIFVYNEDFLKSNLEVLDFCENKKHKGQLVLGTIGADEIKIKSLSSEITVLEEKKRGKENQIKKDLESKLESFKRNYNAKGGSYPNIFSLDSYLNESQIQRMKQSIGSDNPKEVFKKLESINEEEKISTVLTRLSEVIDFQSLKSTIHQSFSFEESQKEIENHINKVGRDWIQKGLHNHDDDRCPFCRQSTIDLSIIKVYDDYIKSNKSKLIEKLDGFTESTKLPSPRRRGVDEITSA